MEPPLQTGLSQEQLATMWEEQNPGRTLGGLHAPVTGTGSFSVNVQGGAYGYGLYEGAPHVTTWEGTRASYGGPVEPMTVGSVPVRRLVRRSCAGSAWGRGAGAAELEDMGQMARSAPLQLAP